MKYRTVIPPKAFAFGHTKITERVLSPRFTKWSTRSSVRHLEKHKSAELIEFALEYGSQSTGKLAFKYTDENGILSLKHQYIAF